MATVAAAAVVADDVAVHAADNWTVVVAVVVKGADNWAGVAVPAVAG